MKPGPGTHGAGDDLSTDEAVIFPQAMLFALAFFASTPILRLLSLKRHLLLYCKALIGAAVAPRANLRRARWRNKIPRVPQNGRSGRLTIIAMPVG